LTGVAAPARERPADAAEVAALLAAGPSVRVTGGETKADWGGVGAPCAVELSTARLDRMVEHNEGDLTAVLEAGVPLARAQERFASAGQRLALDPPDGDGRATVGGVLACGDSGPLRHRHGAIRDLVLGVRVALADGTVARAGSRVIKNVAGYDLAKLMCGALGTLGVVCEVTVRLHPAPEGSVTAVGRGDDVHALARAAGALGARPLELEALDVRWDGAEAGGAVLARATGRAGSEAGESALRVLSESGLEGELVSDDAGLWAGQREAQRAVEGGAVARVSARPSALGDVLAAAPGGAVARAGIGLAWVALADADPGEFEALRAAVAPAACVLQEGSVQMRAAVDVWGVGEGPELELMRRVKERFDPHGVCNPGRFVGGL